MSELKGLRETFKNLEALKRQSAKAVEKQVFKVCADLQGEAQRLAPIDTGDLRGSASTEIKNYSGYITGMVSFNEPYALLQHEELHFSHSDGQAKYLEMPFMEKASMYEKSLQEVLRSSL